MQIGDYGVWTETAKEAQRKWREEEKLYMNEHIADG